MLTVQLLFIVATSAHLSQGLRLWINNTPNLQAPTRKITNSAQFDPINPDVFVKSLKAKQLTKASGQVALSDKNSPSSAAARSYLKAVSLDGLCGIPAQVYLEAILDGKSRAVATSEAAGAFIEGYNTGERLPDSGACKEASKAFQTAFITDEDPILAATLAYMDNWPGVEQGNPCAVSGVDYIKAIVEGKSHLEATTIASKQFAEAFKALAREGKALKDPACAAATKAYWDAIPNKPKNDANSAAFTAFVDKFFDAESRSPAYDPVCLASFEAFLDAFTAGEDLETSNLIAGQAFLKAVISGAQVPIDSACAAATLSYNDAILDKPSSPNAAAMIAYIKEAATGNRKIDPVCAASAEAYFDAYIETKDEDAASEAAAIAYLDAIEKNPNVDTDSPCGKAATAYINEFE